MGVSSRVRSRPFGTSAITARARMLTTRKKATAISGFSSIENKIIPKA